MDDEALGADARTDGELLDCTRAGDRQAFGVLYERRHELVMAFTLKRTRDPEVAMDMMAETFAAALLALVDGSPATLGPPETVSSAAPWLLTIARNTMIDSHRHGTVKSSARERLALEPAQINDNDVQQVLRGLAETDLLIRLSEALPADQFDALRALVLDQRSHREIAQKQLACSAAVTRRPVSCDRPATGHQGNRTSDFHNIYKRQLITAAGTLLPERAP
ncbi:MAG TPA: RNA polymerase sigma factor [Solirubrobacteraceae bacterium]|nr:RNA polymerase sigma factor [Solirubrobacteraceae bacterium]